MRHKEIYDIVPSETIAEIKKITEEIDDELKKDDVDDRKVSQLIYKQFIKGLNMNTNIRRYGVLPY